MPKPTSELLRFIFGSSQVDADIEASLSESDAVEQFTSKKSPLIKALKALGIDTENMTVDPDGCRLVFTDSASYHTAVKALGSVEAVNSLADEGWVCTDAGDVADTTELPQFTLNFLLLDVVEPSKQGKATSVGDLNKEYQAASDTKEVDESVDALLEDVSDGPAGELAPSNSIISPEQKQAILHASESVGDIASVSRFFDAILAASISFHPDSSFSEYVDAAGNALFTPDEAALLDKAMEQTFNIEGLDPYALGFDKLYSTLDAEGDGPRTKTELDVEGDDQRTETELEDERNADAFKDDEGEDAGTTN